MRSMVIIMEEAKLQTLEQIRAFLDGTSEVSFRIPKDERNQFIERVFKRFGYAPNGRADKGVLLRFIERMTGLSRQQVTRLVSQYCKDGKLSKRPQRVAPTNGFSRHYTLADVALLAEVDVLHGTLSGPTTKKLMERAHQVFGDVRFERLSGISISHLYNLRESSPYQSKRRHWSKTNPRNIPIGKRRAPRPNNTPGDIRIDSVHQGDQDGVKGVYHINAVDCVTQMEFVATCEKISEAYLLPVIRQLLDGFPFVILGFHSDNGSEYINYQVAAMLEKLRVEFTKSRPRHSNDNALAESKNASVVRKHFGYAHIPQFCASLVNDFCADHLNPYVNFHRPCFFPETITDAKGKERKQYHYRDMKTPYDKFKSLPNASHYLKPDITLEQLDALATKMSDNDAALALNNARKKLFKDISALVKKRA
jgi:transposase InsO family protein